MELVAGEDSYLNFKDRDFHITVLDLHKPFLKRSKKHNNIDEYISGDAREITTIFDRGSFDVVTSFDLIEHFEKTKATGC